MQLRLKIPRRPRQIHHHIAHDHRKADYCEYRSGCRDTCKIGRGTLYARFSLEMLLLFTGEQFWYSKLNTMY